MRRFFYPQPVFRDGQLRRIDLIDEVTLEIVGSLAGVLADEVTYSDGHLRAKLRPLSVARPGLAGSLALQMGEAEEA